MGHEFFVPLLLFVWVVCLILGGLTAAVLRSSVQSNILVALNAHISGLSLLNHLLPIVLPFLLVYFHIHPTICIIPLCCIKAFALGFCLLLCLVSDPYSGWLSACLLQFSCIVTAPPILFYWSICFDLSRKSLMCSTTITCVVLFLIWLLDRAYIVSLIPSI